MAQIKSEFKVEVDGTAAPTALISDYPLRVILMTGERLLEQKRYDVAARVFIEALLKRPWSIRGLTGLGIAYNAMNRPSEAARCFAQVMSYRPDLPKAMEGCGHAFSMLENYSKAESWYRRSVTAAPTARSVSIALGVTKLRRGDWQQGFALYDQREGVKTLEQSIGSEKIWDGHTDLDGKTIFVIGEQGYGDHIQFARYCAFLKEKGARVIFFTREPLRKLFEWIPSIDRIVVDGQKAAFDYAVMAMSLPGLFNTEAGSVPFRTAYIFPPRPVSWDSRTSKSGKPRIALAWKGNPNNSRDYVRSCPSELIAELVETTDGAHFHVLPFELGSEQSAVLRNLPQLCGQDGTFADVALALDDIDLVISVDTSLAHLAGALGKKTWLMIGRQPDWRWLTAGEDALWYDSIHMFRMGVDWPQLIDRIKQELDRFLRDSDRQN